MKDPNNTRDTVPRRGSPLWVFVTCVIGVGFAAYAFHCLMNARYRTIGPAEG
jgi:hypothetical protein